MSEYLDSYEYLKHDLGPELQAIDINEVLSEGSYREKQRIIKMLENKMNSIPFKIGKKSDRLVVKKTIQEIIRLLRAETDRDYQKTA